MMNSSWQDYLGAQGARIENESVLDFGDPAGELSAARDATIIVPLSQFGLLECSGADAQSFLHNQLTSDVKHLETDSAQLSSWCSAKGRMLASFWLYRQAADYRVVPAADLLEFIRKRLQIYVLRSQVTLSDLSDTSVLIGLSGTHSVSALRAAALEIPQEALETRTSGDCTVIRLDSDRFILVVSCDAAAALWTTLCVNARPAGVQVWQWLDILAGMPSICAATQEEFVPQMVGFDTLGGVSFRKGCYPGQEVVARAKYLGKVKRHLYRIHACHPVVPGMLIFSPKNADHPCGMVSNAAPSPAGGYDALAVIQESFVPAGHLYLDTPERTEIQSVEMVHAVP